MTDKDREERAYYNLEGGYRHLVVKNGTVKAVAPGLRIVEATDEEKEPFKQADAEREEPLDYGLPV